LTRPAVHRLFRARLPETRKIGKWRRVSGVSCFLEMETRGRRLRIRPGKTSKPQKALDSPCRHSGPYPRPSLSAFSPSWPPVQQQRASNGTSVQPEPLGPCGACRARSLHCRKTKTLAKSVLSSVKTSFVPICYASPGRLHSLEPSWKRGKHASDPPSKETSPRLR
jgi:hypothetical protein